MSDKLAEIKGLEWALMCIKTIVKKEKFPQALEHRIATLRAEIQRESSSEEEE